MSYRSLLISIYSNTKFSDDPAESDVVKLKLQDATPMDASEDLYWAIKHIANGSAMSPNGKATMMLQELYKYNPQSKQKSPPPAAATITQVRGNISTGEKPRTPVGVVKTYSKGRKGR